MAKGKLKSRRSEDVVLDNPSHTGALRAPSGETVEMGNKPSITRGIKLAFLMIMGIIGIALFIYTALGATLMAAVPEKAGGFTWVQRATFVGGVPEKGTYVYASMTEETDNSIIGKLKQTYFGVPDPGVFRIVAGPYGEVTNQDGKFFVNGKDSGEIGTLNSSPYVLSKEYLAICQDGSCEIDKAYILPPEMLVGEANASISSSFAVEKYGEE
jgi:hypothetical protein